MSADFKTIIEIYNNSKKVEKLIFIDVLNDLIKWIFKSRKAKKIPQSIYIEELAKDSIKEMNFESIREYNNFIVNLKDFIYKWVDIENRKIWIFNVNKWTPLIPKNIKKYYHQVWEEELEIIHQYRKLFLINLEKYWFIEIFISKNEKLNKLCEDFLNTITELDNKNRKIYIWLGNIKDVSVRRHFERLQIDYWVEKIKKQIEYLFNDMELENYLCTEENLIKLYEKITWEKIHKDYVEFNFVNDYIILTYKWKELEFEKWHIPYMILEKVLPAKQEEWIEIEKLFKHIYWLEYFHRDHRNELSKIRSAVSWINRRFVKIHWKTEKLLSFKDNALIRVK